jgi:hypothetical protein
MINVRRQGEGSRRQQKAAEGRGHPLLFLLFAYSQFFTRLILKNSEYQNDAGQSYLDLT